MSIKVLSRHYELFYKQYDSLIWFIKNTAWLDFFDEKTLSLMDKELNRLKKIIEEREKEER